MRYILRSLNGDIPQVTFDAADAEALEEAIQEYLCDLIEDSIKIQRPQGYFPDIARIDEELYANARASLQCGAQKYVLAKVDGLEVVPLYPILDEIIKGREWGEGSSIDVGFAVIAMLERFLNEGVWRMGLCRVETDEILVDPGTWPSPVHKDGSLAWIDGKVTLEPVIWFGLDGEKPIECWTIDRTERQFATMPYDEPWKVEQWKSFWFNHFWNFDWNILFNHSGDGVITWMFAECGMEEPEAALCKVKTDCPIELCEDDSREVFCKKIDECFLKFYHKARGTKL